MWSPVPISIVPPLPPIKVPPTPPPPPLSFSPTVTLFRKALNVELVRFIVPLKANGLLVLVSPTDSVVRSELVPRLRVPPAGIVTDPLDRFPPTVNSLAVTVLDIPSVKWFVRLSALVVEYPTRTEFALIVLLAGKRSWPPTSPCAVVPTQSLSSRALSADSPLTSSVLVKLPPPISARPTSRFPTASLVPTLSVPPPRTKLVALPNTS